MYQLKTYTLSSHEALITYATVHWPRHIASMPKFGATVEGFWTEEASGNHRLIALLSFKEGVTPDAFFDAYVASPELAADMESFDVDAILHVEDLLLNPVAGSPLS